MIIAIYEVAMYEIVSMIKKACPTYDFFSVPEENGYQENNETVDAIFQYTDKLEKYFPTMDVDTYTMIVCGAIMQTCVSNLAYCSDLNGKYFSKLQSSFADEKTKAYFSHIFYAIDAITNFHYFDPDREIIEWPDEFCFTFSSDKYTKEDYHEHLLEAIELCPEYAYAYCLLDVPHLNTFEGVHFAFNQDEEELKKAFVKSHRYLGGELFRYLFFGTFMMGALTYEIIGDDYEMVVETVADYVTSKGYSIEEVKNMEIHKGYFQIDGKLYPAGIPYFTRFDFQEYKELIGQAFQFVNTKDGDDTEPLHYLTKSYRERVDFQHYPIYGGMLYLMPLYDCFADMTKEMADYLHLESMNHLVYRLLSSNAQEMDRLEEANKKLEQMNADLQSANESLKRHIALNQELVRSLSHSSANYLNSEKLAQTGIELHKAEKDSPTVDELHLEGLSLLLQSEQEMFLSRQLNSLVWRCSVDLASLTEKIREGLSKSEGCSILSPIEFAMKTVLARVLFREEDRRGQFIRSKLNKTEEEMTKMKSAFMLDVLASDTTKEGPVTAWWNCYIGPLSIEKSAVWEELHIIKEKSFYDLIVEIVTEQILNVMSHGDLNQEIRMELGQAEELAGCPRWTYVRCTNTCGQHFTGGRNVGISTLNETLLLLNRNKRGVETEETEGKFMSKAWLLASLLRAL